MFYRRAFTFVELMVVLTIVAILMAIAIPNFLEFQTRGVVTRSRTEMVMIKMAIEQYRLDYRAYPPNREPGQTHPGDLTVLTTPVAYLTLLPFDPFTTNVGRSHKHPRPIERRPYQYFNALQLNPELGLQIKNGDFWPNGGFAAGLLWGLGPGASLPVAPWEITGDPALMTQWEKAGSCTLVSPDGSVELLAYDPTNGTTSRGDIHQLIN